MTVQLLAGWLYTDAGVAISGATVDLFARNTTTPVLDTTTTSATGYWAFSYATEGRYDVRITNGSSIRWRKYDTSEQITALEVQTLRVRNPALTFDYDIVPAAITADRQLNLPLVTGTDTLGALGLAQTWTAVQTLNSPVFVTPALGTPASGTLTNATGLPVAGIAASTSTALGVGSIELGHATDTTLSRVSAGVVAVEGITLVDLSSSQTLTTKTLTSPVINTQLTGTAVGTGASQVAAGDHTHGASATADMKDSVLVATTANITLSGEQTLDGVLTSTSRVLVKNQTAGAENGIYVSAAGAWARAADADVSAEVTSGMFVPVSQGTVGADTVWSLTTNDPITLGTTALVFTAVAAALSSAVRDFLATPSSANLATLVTDETGSGALVFGTSPTLITPALGTPASGVGTNLTGIPAAAILAGSFGTGAFVISTSLQAATIELGHATDTTLSRVSAGLIAVEGVTVVDVSTAQTLTNKTLTSPTLTTPALGTPASGVLTNMTGLPVAGGGTGAATLTGIIIGAGTAALTGLALTASQSIRMNAGGTAYEGFTPGSGTVTSVTGTAPVASSGGATPAISITGAAGQVLAGSGPAFTATPTLGASGTLGSLAMGNATSGTITLQPVTGALGTVTLSLPAATDTLVGKATTDTLTNKTLTSPVLTTPALGTPASGVMTNVTGIPVGALANGTDGNLITWDANGVAAVVATGTAAQVLTSNGAGAAPTFQAAGGGSGAVTRAGGNTTEATTTSVTATDLLTAASLTIGTTSPIWFVVAVRKTAGAATAAAVGLKLNATITVDPTTAATRFVVTSATDQAESRFASVMLAPRITNYNDIGSGIALVSAAAGTAISVGGASVIAAAQPIATITDVVLRGITDSASVTLGVDELHVMTLATS